MPTARGNAGQLRAAVVYWFVHGQLPPHGGGERDGMVEAFVLKYDWAARAEKPAVVDEVRRIWAAHAAEILTATPAGAEPWIVAALRSPELHEEEDEP